MNKILFVLTVFVFIFSYQNALAIAPTAKETISPETKVEIVTPTTGLDKMETKLREVFWPMYVNLEVFRNKQSEYFTIVRDEAKTRLGISLTSSALDKMKPFLAPPAPPSSLPGEFSQEGLEIKKLDNPVDYGVLIGSTALASLFSSPWMFYAIFIVVIFFVIRLIFKMVF